MTSFDIDSLFTNIPLNETIDICVKKLFGRKRKYKNFTKDEFRQLLELAVKDSLFLFNGKYYIQLDGVAMGNPLGPTLANVFLCYWEEKWLDKCPKQFLPLFYNRFMDDTFVLFSSEDHVKKFHKYLNSRHENMNFTFECEKNNCLPFLDVLVSRTDNGFSTSIYRKPTFSGLYTNFDSFIPEKYKKGLILCLLYRAFSFVTSWDKFQHEVNYLKNIFSKNNYPEHFFDKCLGLFLAKRFSLNKVPSKEKIIISLPFMGKYSNVFQKQFDKLVKNFKNDFKLSIAWNSPRKLKNLFHFKDRLPMGLRSKILYSYTCDGCNSVYYGKSKRHFTVRAHEHLGLSLKTGKRYSFNPKNNNNSSVLLHINSTSNSCIGSINNFKIIGSAPNDFFLRIKESLLIRKFKPSLNYKEKLSIPLLLFDN